MMTNLQRIIVFFNVLICYNAFAVDELVRYEHLENYDGTMWVYSTKEEGILKLIVNDVNGKRVVNEKMALFSSLSNLYWNWTERNNLWVLDKATSKVYFVNFQNKRNKYKIQKSKVTIFTPIEIVDFLKQAPN
jgi:hypothetical protein